MSDATDRSRMDADSGAAADGHCPEELGKTTSPARRRLVRAGLGIMGAGYAAMLGYPVYRYLATPARRAEELGRVTEVAIPAADLPEPGSAMIFRFGPRPAMLIHHADGEIVCFDAVCTHLGCTVSYQPGQERIFCACHGGVYDTRSGGNVAGPPPRPLNTFRIEVTDDQVVIHRV